VCRCFVRGASVEELAQSFNVSVSVIEGALRQGKRELPTHCALRAAKEGRG
jgi:hypothetical protein